MAEIFDIEQLVLRVNRRLVREGIEVVDGRAAAEVTVRNVRYYQTMGLLPPVLRHEGRAGYSTDHVEAVVSIKRSQAQGRSLSEMPRQRDESSRVAVLNAALTERSSRVRAAWVVDFTDSVQLLGTGPAPTTAVIDAIAALLASDVTPASSPSHTITEESSS